MADIDPNKILRIPIARLEKPVGGMCEVLLDRWWIVDPKVEAAIFYQRERRQYSSALCNMNEGIARRILQRSWADFGFEVSYIPVAIVPIWTMGDYDFGYELGRLMVPDGG